MLETLTLLQEKAWLSDTDPVPSRRTCWPGSGSMRAGTATRVRSCSTGPCRSTRRNPRSVWWSTTSPARRHSPPEDLWGVLPALKVPVETALVEHIETLWDPLADRIDEPDSPFRFAVFADPFHQELLEDVLRSVGTRASGKAFGHRLFEPLPRLALSRPVRDAAVWPARRGPVRDRTVRER